MWELHDGQNQTPPHDEGHVLRMIYAGLPAGTMIRAEGTEEWRSLRTHAPFAMALDQRGTGMVPPPAPWTPSSAKRVSKSEFVGVGCLVQGFGIAVSAFALFAFGPTAFLLSWIPLLLLIIIGSRMSTKWSCGACGNRIDGSGVTLCPACKAALS